MPSRSDNWVIRKPAVASAGGLVSAQHHEAAEMGAGVLAAGGNAVDAAVATALAIGGVEPWNSGIGGSGFMVVYVAAEKKVHVVDYGTVAPRGLDLAHYALAGGSASDDALFVWPRVVDDRNMLGATAVGVPGTIAGMALALERFGTFSWRDAIAPAVTLAERGLPLDWHATLTIALGQGSGLGKFDESRRVYLADGAAPSSTFPHKLRRLKLGRLADTLKRLQEAGPRDYYEGEVARMIVDDLRAAGGAHSLEDFAAYKAQVVAPLQIPYRDVVVNIAGGFTGGPTFSRAMRGLEKTLDASHGLGPEAYLAYAEALSEAYAFRFAELGHAGDPSLLACTTHLSVVDGQGNMVALTNTLLERFGSRLMLPQTGIMMNNGIMWFDPRPGRANSLAPGKRPLSNMVPLVATRGGEAWFAMGGSGGRRILPAAFQMASFLVDFGMSLDAAAHTPRIDASGGDAILCDERLAPEVIAAIRAKMPAEMTEATVSPKMFANIQAVLRQEGMNYGVCSIPLPTARVMAAGETL